MDTIKRIKVLEKQVQYYKSLCLIDELTGLYNRRYFDIIFKRQKAIYERHYIPFVLTLLDVDNFKEINDKYGHIKGDKVLISIAKEISKSIRLEDYCVRYGGDEFIIISSACNTMDIPNIENKIDSNKLSYGSAEYNYKDTQSIIIAKADKMMYDMKNKKKRGDYNV